MVYRIEVACSPFPSFAFLDYFIRSINTVVEFWGLGKGVAGIIQKI